MGWKTIGNRQYYYQNRREGGRVVSRYIGSGCWAELLALKDEQAKNLVRSQSEDLRRLEKEERQAVLETGAGTDLVNTLIKAVLLASGYHAHKRQWRKRRG